LGEDVGCLFKCFTLIPDAQFYGSVEWRCFGSGELPGNLVRLWMQNHARREPARTDTYLLFPHARTVGVKMREGKLEVKALIQPKERTFRLSAFPDEQHLESWEKWSLEQAHLEPLLDQWAGVRPRQWLELVKCRWLFYFSAEEDGPARVQCELSELEVEKQVHWSLSLEAFPLGPDASQAALRAARLVVEPALQELPASAISALRIMSYPRWLGHWQTGA